MRLGGSSLFACWSIALTTMSVQSGESFSGPNTAPQIEMTPFESSIQGTEKTKIIMWRIFDHFFDAKYYGGDPRADFGNRKTSFGVARSNLKRTKIVCMFT
jgi:hypothetical protein